MDRVIPDTSPLETALRGTVMYFVLLVPLRLIATLYEPRGHGGMALQARRGNRAVNGYVNLGRCP